MTRQCKRFDTSLKLEVVRMIKEQGFSVQRSCCILGVSRSGYYVAAAAVPNRFYAKLASI